MRNLENVPILSNWDDWLQNLHNSLMCGLCCVFIIVSMSKLRNTTGEGEGAGQMRCDVEKNLITAYLAHPLPHEQMWPQCAGVLKNDSPTVDGL